MVLVVENTFELHVHREWKQMADDLLHAVIILCVQTFMDQDRR